MRITHINNIRFKLHLCPDSLLEKTHAGASFHPLPPGKTVVDVFADMLSYLYICARQHIITSHSNGQSLWESAEPRLEVVLSHPNGWEGAQQSQMRKAAV